MREVVLALSEAAHDYGVVGHVMRYWGERGELGGDL